MLGVITTSFLLGIGIFQIIVGMLAIKYDLRLILIIGTIMLSISSLLSGLAFEVYQMIILRFFVGVGMAFFFGPSVILISKYLGKGSEGLGIGLLNSAHSLGGLVGIFVWILIAEIIGWRTSLLISGGMGIISGIFLAYTLYKKREQKNTSQNIDHAVTNNNQDNIDIPDNHKGSSNNNIKSKLNLSNLKLVLVNRSMIIIGLSLLGTQIGWSLVFTFTVFYLKDYLFIDPFLSGLITGLPMFFNVIFAPLFGKIYDKLIKKNSKDKALKYLIICGIILSSNIALFSLSNIYIIILSIILIGIFASGGFVIPYSMARKITVSKLNQPQYETLSVSFINGLSLFGGFWVPLMFSFIVQIYGYPLAWISGSLITLIFIIPLVKLKL